MPASSPASRRVLIIAGSDSSGGAGLEADQRVLALHGCYALTAITGVTSQTTTGVHDIHEIPTRFVLDTINRVWDDIGVDVVKIGMLTSAATAAGVASLLSERRKAGYAFSVVLDPVMKSTSGAALLPADAASIIRNDLLPLATVVTPNIPEAEALCSSSIESTTTSTEASTETSTEHNLNPQSDTQSPPQDTAYLPSLAQRIWTLSSQGTVLVKGGHASHSPISEVGTRVVDVLYDGKSTHYFEKDYIKTGNVHGTGCSLASAIAANLALGFAVHDAIGRAIGYVEKGIRAAVDWRLGKGGGPIDHWAGLIPDS